MQKIPGIVLGLLIGLCLASTAQAAEPEACWFGLLACENGSVVWEAATPENQTAQLNPNRDGLAGAILYVTYFFRYVLMPTIMALAALFFFYQVVRYMFLTGGEEDRKKGKQTMLWGILAFTFILSIWALVGIVTGDLGIGGQEAPCPDYFCN